MARDLSDETPIDSGTALVEWVASGARPAAEFRIGTEHEKVPFRLGTREPVPYDGEDGIEALLEGMRRRLGWEPILDRGRTIGLDGGSGGGAISLEPGGQFELSGAPLATLHDTEGELDAHLALANEVGRELGIGFLSLGLSPLWRREATPTMPKQRYAIMTRYMPQVGAMGLDMMYRTATVQVNLDFASEADMVRKMRVGLALQPIATALFANSPFLNGRPNGFASYRSEIWRHTDLDRTGMLAFAFEDGMGFERYVDWALDVPLYFVKRGDTYHDVAGASFRDLLAGTLHALPGERAVLSDWANHMGTLFPEVRLKRYLEMRGADTGPPSRMVALSAFWVGLLYDGSALDAAWDLVRGWSPAERQALRDSIPRAGLATPFRSGLVADIARQAVDIARSGLEARGRLDAQGRSEARHLDALAELVDSGRTGADTLMADWSGPWGRDIAGVFESCRF